MNDKEVLDFVLGAINGKPITSEDIFEEEFMDALKDKGITLQYQDDVSRDTETHRWYELITVVLAVVYSDKVVGYIKGYIGNQLYSEQSDWLDICATYDFKVATPAVVTLVKFDVK